MNDNLIKLFEDWAKEKLITLVPLPESGSNRKYFRLLSESKTAIGVFNPDRKENLAFITFTKHFLKKGLKVPRLYTHDLKQNIYLIEDLGDTTLFSLIDKKKTQDEIPADIINYYKDSLKNLIRFQIDGGNGLDYSVCYPREKFDKKSILWDLNYFKYYFIKLLNIPFDEQGLEDDFKSFSDFLLSTETKYFMYRDFQSRNIIVHNDELYFVDYQGGRKGALQYDLASLLFQAKMNLSTKSREELLSFYLEELSKRIKINRKDFKKYYYGYVLIRILQTLGAYGFRGYFEKKAHFLISIPYALKSLQWLVDEKHLPKKIPELTKVINSILKNEELNKIVPASQNEKLRVSINSFSYKRSIPIDFTGNGGGFVFDSRAIPNPGRIEEFKKLTGKDEKVIRFLDNDENAKNFLKNTFEIIDQTIANYLERNFKNLMVNFGCTGGQHRSVYCAEKLSQHLKENFNVDVTLNHSVLARMEN
ncbi:MAG TPA: RNase adapter RapZ [Ignavibacteriaceae bacterium]|nr:RNase adapter RapZ [Ignavibacteriaceae bacterium]